ncbi:hypothetical protein B0H14DRAFT_3423102 [Mycena olivaceomarginata]|nr:hypothetical protein B0H14DRAFT_3423102 [Mycena olivaceomarginata]
MEPHWRWRSRHTLQLETTVPIVVQGDNISEQPAEHYQTPGQLSPVILASPANIVFQPASPAITEEPLGPSLTPPRSDDSFDPYWHWRMFYDYTTPLVPPPDPASRYNKGDYSGLLWKKKVVTEERRILPPVPAESQDEGRGSQHLFVAAP